MSLMRRAILLGVVLAASSAWAGTILTPASGSITLTGIVDPSFNFLGLDIRGTAGFMILSQPVVVTDIFSSATFGNTTLVAMATPFDGSAVQITFNPATLLLVPGPGLKIDATGTALVGTPGAAVGSFIGPLAFDFTLTSTAPSTNGNTAAIFTLTDVTVPGTLTPEPTTLIGVLLGAGALGLGRRFRLIS